jgi:hypothetical protein
MLRNFISFQPAALVNIFYIAINSILTFPSIKASIMEMLNGKLKKIKNIILVFQYLFYMFKEIAK